MKQLYKKLLRDIKGSFIQFCAITIVSAIGVMLLTGMATVHNGLSSTINDYYNESNIADLTLNYTGIDNEGINTIRDIDGVESSYGRLKLQAEDKDSNASFLLHSFSENQDINIPALSKGKLPSSDEEAMISNSYAEENNLNIGDKVNVEIRQETFELTISGFFETAEYAYLLEDPTKSLIPNHKNFGLLFVDQSFVERINDENLYNEVLVTIEKDVDRAPISEQIENRTEKYGFSQLTYKENQYSYQNLESDITTAESVSKLFPYIFFLVAAVIVYISMSRTISNEKNQIGIMKALGISQKKIALHYVSYSIASGLIGGIIGNILGITILPNLIYGTYNMLYTLPELTAQGYWGYVITSIVVVVIIGMLASLLSIRKILKESPAQIMRPTLVKKAHKIWIEKRKSIWKKLSFKNKLILRNIFLNKFRVILSSFGIIGCVGLLLCGFGLKEATGDFIDIQFNKIQKYDAMAINSVPMEYKTKILFEDEQIDKADKMSVIDIKVETDDEFSSSLYALAADNNSIQLFDIDKQEIELPNDGIVVPYKLAQEHGINEGDTISIKIDSELYDDKRIDVNVTAISELYVSQDFYTSYEYLQEFEIDPFVNGYYLTVGDQTISDDLITDLEGTENIQSVAVKSQLREDMDSLYETTETTVYIMIIMSACLALAVIFNISSINIFERKRDMATLKVLGYHKGEIRSLVNTENFFITTFGCFIGVIFGAILFKFVLSSAESEEMFIPYHVSFTMILFSIVLTYVFTILANLMLRKKINKIDMVESLKSVE